MDSTITLTNQTNLFLSGVEKVVSVCPTELIVVLAGKRLCVLGENMEIQRLDLENKILIIDGLVNSFKFAMQRKGLVKKLFK